MFRAQCPGEAEVCSPSPESRGGPIRTQPCQRHSCKPNSRLCFFFFFFSSIIRTVSIWVQSRDTENVWLLSGATVTRKNRNYFHLGEGGSGCCFDSRASHGEDGGLHHRPLRLLEVGEGRRADHELGSSTFPRARTCWLPRTRDPKSTYLLMFRGGQP